MDRRHVLKRALGAGAAAGSAALVPAGYGRSQGSLKKTLDPLVNRVQRAMLTMQRDAWEQGVAAQTLLGSGETDLVVLMAKEAMVRQIEDGCPALFSCWDGVTDPAAAGMNRIIKVLPVDMAEERNNLILYIREVIDGCQAYQRLDRLFHDLGDHPETFIETNFAQMLAYTIYRGVSRGWLKASYLKQPFFLLMEAAARRAPWKIGGSHDFFSAEQKLSKGDQEPSPSPSVGGFSSCFSQPFL